MVDKSHRDIRKKTPVRKGTTITNYNFFLRGGGMLRPHLLDYTLITFLLSSTITAYMGPPKVKVWLFQGRYMYNF